MVEVVDGQGRKVGRCVGVAGQVVVVSVSDTSGVPEPEGLESQEEVVEDLTDPQTSGPTSLRSPDLPYPM